MSSPVTSRLKTKRIIKRNQKRTPNQDIYSSQKNIPELLLKTPAKPHKLNMDDIKTVKKTFPHSPDPPPSKTLDFYMNSNPYVLGQINSMSFYNGRFYDLLKLKKECFGSNKQTRCNCMKSRCEAKYCDCFAKGIACGPLCGCLNCKNQTGNTEREIEAVDRFCKCSKSGCIKKYCECYQKGNSCSSKCKCLNCQNQTGAH